jgi:N-acetyl-anhydromuramyl-L-alanine amidase AmpD
MALFAEPINPDVINQIKAREKLLGAGLKGSPLGTRNPGIIQAQNSTAWLRLASSVNVEGSSAYAKNTILSGGTQSEGAALRAGLQGSYDLDPELGYRPMAGISSVDFEYYNNGALAKADIQLTCYTPDQFNRIEALFLRPGYSVLVEWGHTSYTTNGSDIVFYENATSPALSAFLNEGATSEDIATKILEERRNTNYNYEGFHGVVVNFNWSYNSDNSYSITVKTITQGSIIESLKINNATPEKLQLTSNSKAEKAAADKAKNQTEAEGGASVVDDALSATGDKIGSITSAMISGIGNLLEGSKNLLADLWFLDGMDDGTWLSKLKTKGDTSQIHRFLYDIAVDFQAPSATEDTGTGKVEVLSKQVSAGSATVETRSVVRINFDVDSEDDQDMGNFQYYITMGAFLEIFKSNFLPKIENGKNYVDIDNKLANTPMITFPGQFSADPLICLIPIEGFPNANLEFKGNYAMLNELPNFAEFRPFDKSNLLLDLMQVYLNFNYIMEVVENTVDEEGNAPLIEFVKNLLAGVNKALGGVNKFDTRIIEDNPDGKKVLSIYDEGAHIRTNDRPPTLLKPYGINKSGGSTFTAIEFQSELSNEFASMISIGAQSEGNQVGENATAFSQFNKGLTDRITPVKTTGANTTEENTETPEEKFKSTLTNIDTALQKIYKNFQIQKDNIETLTSANSTYAPYLVGYATDKGASPAPFFIPFNLSFTLKGIAGIRIFDKLYLEDNILPISYRGKVAFLAKNVKHSVDKNNWTTTIETLTVPTSGKTVPISVTLGPAIKGEPIIQEYPEVNDDQIEATAGTNAKSLPGGPPGKGGQTLIQKNTLGEIYYAGPTEKSIIVLHHTAGGQDAKATIAGWNTRTDRVSTHFVLEKSGNYDQLYDYKAWGNHIGITADPFKRVGAIFQNFNKTTIGIEIINIGPLVLREGKLINTYDETAIKKGKKTVAQARKYTLGVDASKSVDANGKEAPYKGYSYWEKYPQAQLLGLEKILRDIIAKNPKCKITYNFNDYFPPQGTESANAIRGVTGTYTHNSFKQGKVDVGPVPEIIALLKRLTTAPPVEESIIDQVEETLDTVFNPTLMKIANELIASGSINYQQEIEAKDAAIKSIQRNLDTIKSNPVLKKNLEDTLKAADTAAGKGWNKQYLAYLAWIFGSRDTFWTAEPKRYYQSPNTFDSSLEEAWEAKLDEWMKRVKATPIKSDL